MNYQEAEHNRLYSEFQQKGRIKECFYCGAKSEIILSHSVSEKRCLGLLTEFVGGEKGLYGFKHIELNATNWFDPYNSVNFEIVGTKKASTFKGFCKEHDQKLFKLLDDFDFDDTSMECKFKHCYRAFAKAVHTKNEELTSCNADCIYKAQNQTYIAERKEDIEIGLHLDLSDYKCLMNEWLKNEDYTQLEHFCFRTSKFHPIASSSFCQPSFTINNYRINDYKNTVVPLNHIFINIIPEKEWTYILLSCFKNQPKSIKFLLELEEEYKIDKEHFGTFLTTLLIFYTENTFIAPSLVESLPYNDKRSLLLNLRHSITAGIQEDFIRTPINGSLNLFKGTL